MTILIAGATGHLGGLITEALLRRGAKVRALVRATSDRGKVEALRTSGAEVVEAEWSAPARLREAATGADCVVSALSGLHDTIVEAQRALAEAAMEAGVPRLIPSDFSIDFTKTPAGRNRNLDLRRAFGAYIDGQPIRATSVLNGMFTDLLTGQAPVILFGPKRVVYWGDADMPLDFTTTADTALYTAAAALDPATPRYLRIAGEVASARGLQAAASEVTGHKFKLLRAGGLGTLQAMIRLTKTLAPAKDEVFPPWQGMQYLRDMFTGLPKLEPLDNDRYDMQWTGVREVLRSRQSAVGSRQ